MPEYLAPGVYVEETSFRAKSIEGVSTSTAGFVGPARYGPVEGLPELVTSFPDFERIFGGLDRLEFDGETDPAHNYLAHGVRNFFDNGGKRLYVSRVFRPISTSDDGRAFNTLASGVTVRARYPGKAGECRVSFTFRVGGNALSTDRAPETKADFRVLRGINPDDVVWVSNAEISPPASTPGQLMRAERYFDDALKRSNWRLYPVSGSQTTLDTVYAASQTVHRVTATVEVTFLDRAGKVLRRDTWDGLGFHPDTRRSLGTVFADDLPNRADALRTPIVLDFGSGSALDSGPEIVAALISELPQQSPPTGDPDDVLAANGRSFEVALAGGDDGARPQPEHYEGEERDDGRNKTGLLAFEDVSDISIVAAPGYSSEDNDDADPNAVQSVTNALISHCERMQYRIAVLDAVQDSALADVRQQRAQVDSTHAALYYPWVRVLDPVTDQEITLPPSGFVAGIYARNDVENGVHKAPANEVVRGALGFEITLNKAQQDVLNPEGINCFRFFEGRGNRLWGARTISSDPEWKYVNLRRYFAFLERSIERGTQWVVFENNSEALWANVRRTIEDFLFNEWKQGHLMGDKPEMAYFVRCDRSTMTQNDFDNGRLICLIGVAPVRPAEFVIFRIGQWTGDKQA